MKRRIVFAYLAHPFSDDPERHFATVVSLAEAIVDYFTHRPSDDFIVPIVPHLMLSVFNECANPSVRPVTEEVSRRLVSSCDEVWLMSKVKSKGMLIEIEVARQKRIPTLEWEAVLERVPTLASHS